MRKIQFITMSCCALVALLSQATFAAAGGELPEPIPTRQSSFSIPFIPPAADQDAVEVRLFVSTDSGTNWAVAGRVDPKQSSFSFRAPRDGEYWFVIRTVDRQGRLKPENGRTPELRVIVDTLPPRLDLQVGRNAAGNVVAHWLAVDPLLKADTLKIEYQAAGESTWHPIQFDPPRDDPSRSTATGDVSWRSTGVGKSIVRAEIRDRAGNTAVTQATVADGPAMEGPALGAPAGPTQAGPTPSGPTPSVKPSSITPAANDRHDLTAGLRSPRRPTTDVNSEPPTAGLPGSAGWPADQVTYQPVGDGIAPGHAAKPQSGGEVGRSIASGNGGGRLIFSQPAGGAPAPGPVESRINPPITDRVVAPPAPAPPAAMFTQGLPPGEHPYMVNSRKFALEYEVQSVGAAGIAKIEIWGTRDGGRTWASYGIEPGREGPVRVSVEGEGLYGFRITVQDANGFGGQPPRSGDLPELWVGVDTTKPVAKITAVEPGQGEHAGELAIHWQASDALLAAHPVSLSFSDRPDGPWSTIAAGLDNTGVYNWRFDNRVPDRILLRLEVQDEAGNVGEFQTSEPVVLDPNRPQGRLRTVRPVDDEEASKVQVYHFYR